MTELSLKKRGLFAVHDTGAPTDGDDYLTLVMLHGFAFHSGSFQKLLPFAKKYNSRIILVNRRGYPETTPFTAQELQEFSDAATPEGEAVLRQVLKDRARDIYELLEVLIKEDHIPQKGGIAVGGWSFGTQFSTALLAYGPSFVSDIDVASYIRSIVNLDAPSHFLRYPPKEHFWNPLLDATLPDGEGVKIFPRWVSGYFKHGETIEEIEPRNFASDPLPTLDRMSPEELQSALYVPPGLPGASDDALFRAIMTHQVSAEVRKAAVFSSNTGTAWDSVKLIMVYGDHSTWSEQWSVECLKNEVKEAERAGRHARTIQYTRLRGGNHFAAWDLPEPTLRALLGRDPDQE